MSRVCRNRKKQVGWLSIFDFWGHRKCNFKASLLEDLVECDVLSALAPDVLMQDQDIRRAFNDDSGS